MPKVPGKPTSAGLALVQELQDEMGKTLAGTPKKRIKKSGERPSGKLITAMTWAAQPEADGFIISQTWTLWTGGEVWRFKMLQSPKGTLDVTDLKRKMKLPYMREGRTVEEQGQDFRVMIRNKFDPMDFEIASPDLQEWIKNWVKVRR